MSDKVLILGCGPAGLFAAHAVKEAGWDPIIVSRKRKSFMRGAQYLHRPIPGLSGDSFQVEYSLKGTVDGYRDKVYGDMGDILVSPETLVGVSDAWDIREAYDKAWDLYQHDIVDVDLTGLSGSALSDMFRPFPLIISTIPAKVLCRTESGPHSFFSQKVWVTDSIKSNGEFEFNETDQTLVDNLVVCSGDPDDWWYRQSRIHGWENTEYPHTHKPRETAGYKVFEVEKPLRNTCTCFPDVVRMGRYGAWQKGILSHEAFYDTVREIVALEQGWVEAAL